MAPKLKPAIPPLATTLPLLALVPSFILTTVSLSRSDWSHRTIYDPTKSDLVELDNIETRSPFWSCPLAASIVTNTLSDNTTVEETVFTPSCVHTLSPQGLCPNNAPRAPVFCQELSLAAELLYAGNALIAAAVVGGIVVVVMGWVGWGGVLVRLLAGLGGLGVLSGVAFAVLALTVSQYPNGDWASTGLAGDGDPRELNKRGPWLLGRDVGVAGAGAVLAGVGAWIGGVVWDGVRDIPIRKKGTVVEGEKGE
ncbi:hypothetical protein OQA88_5354 [Cercophora sp. LCS_1]